jgi:fructuronate reductase
LTESTESTVTEVKASLEQASDPNALRRLSRPGDGRPLAPVRHLHLGLGHFFRAHTAWYSDRVPGAEQWGIAAFAGRSATHIDDLRGQDCLYTLVEQGEEITTRVVASLSAAHRGDDLAAWRDYARRPEVEIVTATVTEGGYRRDASGDLDLAHPDVAADVAALAADPLQGVVTTAPGKFVAALLARRDAAAGPITLVPCDNVVDSGTMVRTVVTQMAEAVDPTLTSWISDNVAFVATMVDRITPHQTDDDAIAVARLTGYHDPAYVMTEPFSEWVLSGAFAGGRPAWEQAGARFTDDIEPFEHRKLWLLNGSHSLMAYIGPLRGHATVGEAISDPVIAGWVDQWWDEACRHIPIEADEIMAYRRALVARFRNPAIKHLLSQIQADGSQKVPMRFVPTILAERKAGRMPTGALRAVAGWVVYLRGADDTMSDVRADEVRALVGGDLDQDVGRVLAWLGVLDAEAAEVAVEAARELVAA